MTLPFVMPDPFSFQRRVFAHYFYPFPLSIGNQPAISDYYNLQYLSIMGENGIHKAYGGYLRSRPLPVVPGTTTGFALANMSIEVRVALARGITGFTFDILNTGPAITALNTLLSAAQSINPRFSIIPMLDMSSLGTTFTVAQAVAMIVGFKHPSFLRLADGRLVFSAFNATLQPLSFWAAVIPQLNAQNVDVAFIPILLGSPTVSPFPSISLGVGGWGTATPNVALSPASYMTPILPQQFRPKSQVFWEASNFDTFRNSWASAIAGALTGATEYAQVITWSDFSESGQIQPYTDASLSLGIGTGFYDLNAYYATWFMSGVQPEITKDVLYWCYKRMNSKVAHVSQVDNFSLAAGSQTEVNNIECLAFLTEPGVLVINGKTMNAPAGITSFKIPATPGNPTFALQRNGSDVEQGVGPVTIYGPEGSPAGTLDLTYWSGNI